MVRERVIKSDIRYENVDYLQALRNLVVVGGYDHAREAGLKGYLPQWSGKRTDLLAVEGESSQDPKMWRDTKRTIPEPIKKLIIARVLEIAVLISMGTHVYSFYS